MPVMLALRAEAMVVLVLLLLVSTSLYLGVRGEENTKTGRSRAYCSVKVPSLWSKMKRVKPILFPGLHSIPGGAACAPSNEVPTVIQSSAFQMQKRLDMVKCIYMSTELRQESGFLS